MHKETWRLYTTSLAKCLEFDRSDVWHRGYKESMQGVRHRLLQRTAKEGGLLYVAELHGEGLVRKMDHLVCFLPGMLPHLRHMCDCPVLVLCDTLGKVYLLHLVACVSTHARQHECCMHSQEI